MGKMECPICGKKFDEEYVDFLDNGNPACPHCASEESKRAEEEGKNKTI